MVTKSLRSTVACPHCGDLAPRVKRTLHDRIASIFTPIKRYRCDYCNWTATFANSRAPSLEVPDVTKYASTP
jgi:transposase-like protein